MLKVHKRDNLRITVKRLNSHGILKVNEKLAARQVLEQLMETAKMASCWLWHNEGQNSFG